jgi:biopolymer transport protein ExbD
MRFRHKVDQGNSPGNRMTSMIDVVFLLLVFFMLTLKVLEPEGDLAIQNLPAVEKGHGPPPINDVQVRLIADDDGSLKRLLLGQTDLGGGERAFERLNQQMLLLIGRPGSQLSQDLAVEIVPDPHLHYQHAVKAISACRGRRDPRTGNIVPYVEKIRFASPGRLPAAGA